MLKYYHHIYTRRDSTGWGLISPEREGIDRQAVEALCRRLPASEKGPVYALIYAAALGGFALCSSAACGSGSDHRGRIVADVIVAADPAARADPNLAALPDRFVQAWDPAWETQAPELESVYDEPAPPTPALLARCLAALGVRESSLPSFLQFLYRALPQQGVSFSLPVPQETAPAEALRALAGLIRWAAPPALARGGTASCGPVAVKDLRFYLSPEAGRHLPALAEGSAQAFFYRQAAEKLRTDPAGYLDFLHRQVLDVLPDASISWQAYPGLFLLSAFADRGEELLRQPEMRTLYLQNLELFLAYQKEYPALEGRLRALFTTLALALDKRETQARRCLLERLTPPGDAQAFAAIPDALRSEAAGLWIARGFAQQGQDPLRAADECRPALDCLTDAERRAAWQASAAPCLAGQPIETFVRVLDGFRLPHARLLRERLLAEMRQIFRGNWTIHPENEKKLAELDRFSRKYDLSDCFEDELLRQLDLAFDRTQDIQMFYCLCSNLLRGLTDRPAVRARLDRYRPKPAAKPEKAAPPAAQDEAPARHPAGPSGEAPQAAPAVKPADALALERWLAQYDALTEELAGLLVRQLEAEDCRLPERFYREKELTKLALKAARQAGLSKAQQRELMGWWAVLP